MILSAAVWRGVADGTVTVAYRRWAQPRVRAGATLHTSAGVIAVDAVEPVDAYAISDSDAHAAGARSADEIRAALRPKTGTGPVYRITLRWIGPDPRAALGDTTDLTPADIDEITTRLARLDRASRHGPWTEQTLAAIAAHPGLRAADLAETLGRDKDALKLDIRKLKNLGLTHSLDIGYRISPRGAAYRHTRTTGR